MSSRPRSLPAWIRLSRPRDWATSKIPFLTASALWAGPEELSFSAVVAMILAIATLAAFGYGVNEVADRATDARAGRQNRAADLGGWSTTVFLVATSASSATLVAAWAPDLRAPGIWLGAVALSVAYSAAPLRLKERGLLGIFAAAAAQWALPVLLLCTIAARGALGIDSWLLALLGLAIGVRWMAVHQLQDAARDRMSGVRTYASGGGAIVTILSFAFRSEIGVLLTATIVSWPRSMPAVFALAIWGLKSGLAPRDGASLRERIATYERAPLSDFYFLLLPLALVASRVASEPAFLLLIPVFLVLGAGQIARVVHEWRP